MIDYKKFKAEELRQLIMQIGYTSEQLNSVKGKTALVELYKRLTTSLKPIPPVILNTSTKKPEYPSDFLPPLEETPTITTVDIPQQQFEEVPDYCSPEWSSYVMNQFVNSELDDKGHPKIAGLRRITNLLLGPIISSGPRQLYPVSDPDGPGRAAVLIEIVIAWGGTKEDLRTFTAIASSWHGNTDDEYAIFPEAMAETRAEARALRKALGLNIVSADETTQKDASEIVQQYKEKTNWEVEGQIKDSQIHVIQVLCDRLGIDITKFINSGEKQYNDIKEIQNTIASKMIQKLNQYQNQKTEIPDNLKKEKNGETFS